MCFCDQVANRFDIERLINDLSDKKREIYLTKEGLTEKEKSLLCAILYFANQGKQYNLERIATEIKTTRSAIANMLSTKIFIYYEKLTHKEATNWRNLVWLLETSEYKIDDKPVKQNPVIEKEGILLITSRRKLTKSQREDIGVFCINPRKRGIEKM